jgi:hypothetical protein
MSRQIYEKKAIGSSSFNITTRGTVKEQVLKMLLNFDTAPTSSGNLIIRYDCPSTYYDVDLLNLDLAGLSVSDLSWSPDGDLILMPGDTLSVIYTNPDSRTYGLKIQTEEI